MLEALTAAARTALKEAVGDGGWSDDPDRLAPHLIDWRGTIHGAAELMLLPRTTAQVVAIVRAAVNHRVAIVPQGGNTGLVGGGIPHGAVLLSMQRLNRIRAIDAQGLTLTAEAGVVLSQVHDIALENGCVFPLSLGAKGSATIGGLVSTNAGGVQVVRHGTMRALTLGLEAVLPDASVLDQLRPLIKDNSGYDIKQLLIGGEGTLGIVTAATLRLAAAPTTRAVAWLGCERPHQALAVLAELRRRGLPVDSFEIVPSDGLELVLRHIPGSHSPIAASFEWNILVELAGFSAHSAMLSALEAALSALLEDGVIGDATIAQTEAQAAALWRLREELPEAERRDGPALHHDIAVPVADMPDFTESAARDIEARWPGARVLSFGHLGDGNLHFNVRPPADADAAAWTAAHHDAVAGWVYELVTAAGGSISAEHGIGTLKRAELARLGNPAKLAAMRAIKAALDPLGIMNPGKVI